MTTNDFSLRFLSVVVDCVSALSTSSKNAKEKSNPSKNERNRCLGSQTDGNGGSTASVQQLLTDEGMKNNAGIDGNQRIFSSSTLCKSSR